ncbi:MAG: SpoVG family protein [Kiritimatiellales bacterium]|nr:SpoVG family protein [Kiritimatiellales bacterium]
MIEEYYISLIFESTGPPSQFEPTGATMEITEIRFELVNNPHAKLRAFCSITLEGCLAVKDIKIIEGNSGLFVSMPSRNVTLPCSNCYAHNAIKAAYCNKCGTKLHHDESAIERRPNGRPKLYVDIVHPINEKCRKHLSGVVIAAYLEEVERSKKPGYVKKKIA